jgi:hypothetical protein
MLRNGADAFSTCPRSRFFSKAWLCLDAGSDFAVACHDHHGCRGRAISLVPSHGATAVAAFVAFIATSPWRDAHEIGCPAILPVSSDVPWCRAARSSC